MSTNKRRFVLSKVSVKLGCTSSCMRPKLSNIFNPNPKPKPKPPQTHHHHRINHHYSSSSTSSSRNTTTTLSPTTPTPPPRYYDNWDTTEKYTSPRSVGAFGRVGGENVAVEKDSDDPYLDFRRSMLQMIVENEIYSKQDLRELLNCFLQLNAPYHHGIIVEAFREIWNGVFSQKLRTGFVSRDF
ncbi:transcription repressor OFP6-like [Tripterygium wilfordii]|uniref:Transcription repressor n=1 Tax=Tripterygium wilfordii TaxID=458696 RepID=A0A7J7DW26_TRIWF|nr:transcription repressor OFP6-like [Tripterygium wilfordii]KAF5750565.1 transcription repressor OFP6-like [Tripterygium wilfordii]